MKEKSVTQNPGKIFLKSVRTLARLHILMKMEPVEEYRERSLREEYLRHNQELRKIRKFIRNKGASNVFEKNLSGKCGAVS